MRVFHRWIWVGALLISVAIATTSMAQVNLPGSGGDDPSPTVEAPAIPVSLRSPRSTLRTFLDAMNQRPINYDAALATLETDLALDTGGRDVLDRLFGVLNRIEIVVYSEHPDARDLNEVSAYRGLAEYRFFPRDGYWRHTRLARQIGPEATIDLRLTEGGWKFSRNTVERVPDLYERFRDFDVIEGLTSETDSNFALWLEAKLHPSMSETFFILKKWQWVGLFLIILLGVVLDFTVRAIARGISRRIISRRGGEAKPETLKKTVRPFGLAAGAIFWLIALPMLGLPPQALKILLPAVRLFAMLAAVWAAYRVTDLIGEVLAAKAAKTHTRIDDLLVPMVRKTVKIFITAIGFIYIADSFDIEILPLLTGLGIGTFAFGLAAKDSIENFFGSIAVISDRPFEVGDWIVVNDVEGVVEDLGFRSTRVRTFYNSLVSVPNATLVRAVVDNYGRRKYRRWTTHIGIQYDTPPDRIESFVEGIRELIRLHPYTRKDYFQVWLHKFSTSSLDILIYVFFEAPDWQTELRERHRLMLDTMRLAQHLGVEFAFPTQTLHVQQVDPMQDPPVVEIPDSDPEGKAQRDGRLAVRKLTSAAAWRREKPGPYRIIHRGTSGSDDETQIESKIGGDG